jgi:hypothetical protein
LLARVPGNAGQYVALSEFFARKDQTEIEARKKN